MTDVPTTFVLHPLAASGVLMGGLAALLHALPKIATFVAAMRGEGGVKIVERMNGRSRDLEDASRELAVMEVKTHVTTELTGAKQYLDAAIRASIDSVRDAIKEQTATLVAVFDKERDRRGKR